MKKIDLKAAKREIRTRYGNKFDVDYIFCELLNVNFTQLREIDKISVAKYNKAKEIVYKNQCLHIPVQKIFNRAYFLNRPFYVNEKVLTPRFETELLVEKAVKILNEKCENTTKNLKVLDLCTGSGVIAVSLFLEVQNKNIEYFASDISAMALHVAKTNAKRYDAIINLIKSDMFENIHEKFDLIVSNPPYIRTCDIYKLHDEVKRYDPLISLLGGDDGMYYYNKIFNDIENYLEKDGVLIMEMGINQSKDLKNLFEKKFKDVTIIKDYSFIDRILICKELQC